MSIHSISQAEAERLELEFHDRAHRMAARKRANSFMEYVLRDEETGDTLQQAKVHKAWQQLCDTEHRLLIWSHVESGKGLAIDTPIPTPDGWRPLCDLGEGDLVYGGDGHPARVMRLFDTEGRPCFRVRFDDGTSLIADDAHRWKVQSFEDRKAPPVSVKHQGDGDLCECGCGLRAKHGNRFVHNHHMRQTVDGWRVMNTAELFAAGVSRVTGAKRSDGTNYFQYKWQMPLSGEVQYPHADLLLDPYVLGVWLGDGDSNAPVITMHEDDREIGDRCEELCGPGRWGFDKRKPHILRLRLGGGVRAKLRAIGVLFDKHIPPAYLLASVDQRRVLLAGLVDTDGTVGQRGHVEFANMNGELALDVTELARSLGFKAHVRKKDVFSPIDKRPLGVCYTVAFNAQYPVFFLERKARKQQTGALFGRARYRSVVAIEETASVPTRCLTVDSLDHTFLAGRSYTVTHNTSQISVGRTLFELGRNQSLRTAIVSNTQDQAKKIVLAISKYIEQSEALQLVFPELQKGDIWTASSLAVKRPTVSKDPSVQAFGIHGAVLGARIDLLVLDDILDFENCRTPALRQELWDWIHSTLMGRLTRNARVWIVGTAFHPDDALHRFARHTKFKSVRYPIVDPTTGKSRWPDRWPLSRIEERREEMSHAPAEWARQFLCVARDDTQAHFKQEWIDLAIKLGEGKRLPYSLERVPNGCKVYTGVDLAVQKHNAAGETVLFTILVHPNGNREVLNIQAGKLSGPEIVQRIIDTHRRYLSIVVVENNACQDFIIQFARGAFAVPIKPFTTGRNKAHPEFGVESIGAEMMGGKWILPNTNGKLDPQAQEWVTEMLYYEPTAHTGDRLMACWFAREGIRMATKKAEWGRLDLTSR